MKSCASKFARGFARGLLLLAFTLGTINLGAVSPTDPPPRGHAYGFYLKEGGRVLFVYVTDDGSRRLELSECKPKTRYLIRWSTDLEHWNDLVTVQIASDGTATAVHTTPMNHCFYSVIRTNK